MSSENRVVTAKDNKLLVRLSPDAVEALYWSMVHSHGRSGFPTGEALKVVLHARFLTDVMRRENT